MDRVVGNQSGGSNMLREYRKGNWTVEETMVLIEAKKMDDERRMKRQGEGTSTEIRGNKPGELRWKWVEDYCWKMGCLRSQNQCNDKWDNLMRVFKKVREYERRVAEKGDDGNNNNNNNQEIIIKSYWKIERSERKEKNLPTNMLPEIYEALVQVVDRKCTQKLLVGGGGGTSAAAAPLNQSTSLTNSLSPTLQQQSFQAQIAALPLPPPPTLSPPAVVAQQSAQPPSLPYTRPLPAMCDSSDPDRSEHSDSPAKRRRKGEGEGTSSGNNNNINNLQEVGSAIFKSAAIIAETIQASEEREERRHRELLSLHERRLQIEESKAEINRQGINGLVDSINRLANSILSLAGNKNQAAPPK
nr:PREDICTED: trihelix transcription factor ASR3-like [Nicotiana tabacum]